MHPQPHPLPEPRAALGEPDLAAGKIQPVQPIVRIVFAHLRHHHHAGIGGGGGGQVEPRQHLGDAAAGQHAALGQQHQMVRQLRHFFDGVADVEQRNFQLIVQPLQVRQDLAFAWRVQRRQRLVHQQQRRAGEQRAGDGHPLPLAAGEVLRRALQQMPDAEQLHRLCHRHPPLGGGHAAQPVFEIAAHRQMREQARFLEHVTQPAPMGGQKYSARIVLPHLAVHREITRAALQPRDQAQAGGFAAAGFAEQCGHAAAGQRGVDAQRKAGIGDVETQLDGAVHGRALPGPA